MNLAQLLFKLATFGWTIWARLLGPKRARVFVLGGMVVSTIVCIVLQLKGV